MMESGFVSCLHPHGHVWKQQLCLLSSIRARASAISVAGFCWYKNTAFKFTYAPHPGLNALAALNELLAI